MNLSTAQSLKAGDYIHSVNRYNADGSPMRARVTSVKLWKRRPELVEVRYKRGLYEYGTITQSELDDFEPGDGRN